MRKNKSEQGATILESLVCILLLCLLFFGLMQIFQWSMAKMLSEYASFYTAKAYSLGYSRSIIQRASRVAITGASGKDESNIPVVAPFTRANLSDAAEEYMSYGRYGPSGINFEYWDPDHVTSETPIIEVNYSSNSANTAYGTVQVKNMPLLSENLSWFVGGVTKANVPSGQTRTYNHSSLFLEGN